MFAHRVAFFGRLNSLSQVLLKLTSPGVPDIYQGTELWDLSLVDPDNRRPVDYDQRKVILRGLQERLAESGSRSELLQELIEDSVSGRIKLYLTHQALSFRRDHRELFGEGGYHPVVVCGEKRDHVCAFLRVRRGETALVVTPRFPVALTQGSERPPLGTDLWKDTRLELKEESTGCSFHNVLTGETVAMEKADGKRCLLVGKVLREFPVALLERR